MVGEVWLVEAMVFEPKVLGDRGLAVSPGGYTLLELVVALKPNRPPVGAVLEPK